MLVEVKVPQLSESVAEATLLEWHKKEGEAVARDENLIDIETDKVVLELPAPADGVLVQVKKGNRGTVVAGEIIAVIDTDAKATVAAPAKAAAPAAPPPPVDAPRNLQPVMPAAQKLAAESGIDTSRIQGSGRDGRVTKGDVLEQMARPASPAAAPAPAAAPRAALQQPASPVNTAKLVGSRPEQSPRCWCRR